MSEFKEQQPEEIQGELPQKVIDGFKAMKTLTLLRELGRYNDFYSSLEDKDSDVAKNAMLIYGAIANEMSARKKAGTLK